MAQTSAGDAPIPPAKKDDSEDVAWALSTAEAMYARGDRGDALKWLRRAAEAASEAQADDRALELAKAAADLASAIGPTTSVPPPPPPPPLPSRFPPSASRFPPAMAPSHPPPAPTPLGPPVAPLSAPPPAVAAPMPPPQAVPSAPVPPAASSRPAPLRASAAPPPPPSSASRLPPPAPPTPSPSSAAPPAPPKAAAARPLAPAPLRAGEPRRLGRRSRPDITIARRPDEVTRTGSSSVTSSQPTPALPRRRRASRPAMGEVMTPAAPPLGAPPVPPPPDSAPSTSPAPNVAPPAPPTPRGLPSTEDMDAWPTQQLAGDDDLSAPEDERTRIGVPAYTPDATLTGVPAIEVRTADPALRPAQAVRVIVWRGPDGVHVAPQGTRVNAISVDAILVALDPSADLAAWLLGK